MHAVETYPRTDNQASLQLNADGSLRHLLTLQGLDKSLLISLLDDAERGANAVISVDLEHQTITGPDGGTIHFEVDAFKKHCLLNGLDDIGLTMEKSSAIDGFEASAAQARPWV